jgi:hypothetical protein
LNSPSSKLAKYPSFFIDREIRLSIKFLRFGENPYIAKMSKEVPVLEYQIQNELN